MVGNQVWTCKKMALKNDVPELNPVIRNPQIIPHLFRRRKDENYD
jgi:hypothetical protein